jgi:Mg2+ and Co2+ transporter CorA
VKNFNILEPMISNKTEYVTKTLENIERHQEEIERAVTMMEKRLGDGIYIHDLSRHLQEYEIMKDEVIRLH